MSYGIRLVMFLFLLPGQASYGQQPVFVAGMGGYTHFRMPVLVRLGSGQLVALCEAGNGGSDTGANVVVMRSSSDEGQRWSLMRVVDASDTSIGLDMYRELNATRRGGRLALGDTRTLAICKNADSIHGDSLTLRVSADGGANWGPRMLIDGGGASEHTGLCDLVDLGGGDLGVLYERDRHHEIIFTEVDGVVKSAKTISRQQWNAVEGIYRLRRNPTMFIRFSEHDGELVARFLWDFRISMNFLPDSPLVFIRKDAGKGARNRIRFRQDADGKVDAVTMGNGSEWDRIGGMMLPPGSLAALAGNYQSTDDPDNRIAVSADSGRLVVKQVWDGQRIVLTPLSRSFFFSDTPFFTLDILSSGEGGEQKAVKLMGRYNFLFTER